MLTTNVKASSITNLTDARYFAAKEVKWVGFSLDPGSDNFIEPAKITAIKEWLDGVAFVGEFGIQTPVDVHRLQDVLELDMLQLGHFTPVDVISEMPDLPKIKEVVIEMNQEFASLEEHLARYEQAVDLFLLDFTRNGFSWNSLSEKKPFGLEQLQSICKAYPVILELDWDVPGLEQAVQNLELQGISLKGGLEEKVGYKSFDEVDELFEAIEEGE